VEELAEGQGAPAGAVDAAEQGMEAPPHARTLPRPLRGYTARPMSREPTEDELRQKIEATIARMGEAARRFVTGLRSEAGIEAKDLVDPEGESVGSLVDVEGSAGAASLAMPIDLITFETWLLGQIGDRDELDLDVGRHHELWLGLGAWVAELLRERHGAFWLIGGEDVRVWRMGFPKVLLEIQPHVFAERLLRSGQGLAKRLVAEIEKIREQHAEADRAEGGTAKDKYGPPHYARLHSVPLAQWLVLDMAGLQQVWGKQPASELGGVIREGAKRLPPQNQPVVEAVLQAIAKLDQAKPAYEQVKDRHLFEAVAQIVALRRATNPVAIDILEKLVMPALHMGVPKDFPPLDEDDLDSVKKGNDLFAVMVEVVPFQHRAEEGGFLNSFAQTDLGTPYPDRNDLQIGRGDWVMVNSGRLRPMTDAIEPQALVDAFDRFVGYVQQQPDVPSLRQVNRGLAEQAARTLGELKQAVNAAAQPGGALVFRLLPPPG
jgi:hypothetical protein